MPFYISDKPNSKQHVNTKAVLGLSSCQFLPV